MTAGFENIQCNLCKKETAHAVITDGENCYVHVCPECKRVTTKGFVDSSSDRYRQLEFFYENAITQLSQQGR